MPTRRVIFLCWLLFTIGMLVVGWLLRASLPGALGWLNELLGADAVTVVMLAAWCIGAFFAYRPLLRASIAKRRRSTIRQ